MSHRGDQHSIDLLPADLLAQSQAGLRKGRFGGASAVVIVCLVIAATHSRWMLRREQMSRYDISAQASQVFETEASVAKLRRALANTQQFISIYHKVAYPIEMSAVLATVIKVLPDSVTLDQIDLNAGARQTARTARFKGERPTGADKDQPTPPRMLIGEISGFAASDQHIAELVSRLSSTAPFRDVTLDFSRTRDVRGQSAREFRLSFHIDLDVPYQTAGQRHSEITGGGEVVAHVN